MPWSQKEWNASLTEALVATAVKPKRCIGAGRAPKLNCQKSEKALCISFTRSPCHCRAWTQYQPDSTIMSKCSWSLMSPAEFNSPGIKWLNTFVGIEFPTMAAICGRVIFASARSNIDALNPCSIIISSKSRVPPLVLTHQPPDSQRALVNVGHTSNPL